MKKKKNIIIIIIIAVFIAILITSVLIINHNNNKIKEDQYQAQLKENTIIKYLSKNDIIKVVFEDNKSNIYYNDEKVGIVKTKEDKNKIIEEYYNFDHEDYEYKRIIYKNDDDLINYSELYDYDDKLINTMYFDNNKVKKIVYADSFLIDEYKNEEKKLIKYTYKKDILYSKCKYDNKNVYITFCEFYDKKGNIISTREDNVNEYGFVTNRTINEMNDKTTENISYEIKKDKITIEYKNYDNKKNNIVSSIYDFSLFGTKILYNTPYLYNRYYFHAEKYDNSLYYYDDKNINSVMIKNDSNGYSKMFNIYLKDRTEMIELHQGVKFKTYDDVMGYYKNIEDNIYNVSGYSYEKKEFIKDAHVKSVYRSGNVEYYDWFSENEISEEEYNLMIKELSDEIE